MEIKSAILPVFLWQFIQIKGGGIPFVGRLIDDFESLFSNFKLKNTAFFLSNLKEIIRNEKAFQKP